METEKKEKYECVSTRVYVRVLERKKGRPFILSASVIASAAEIFLYTAAGCSCSLTCAYLRCVASRRVPSRRTLEEIADAAESSSRHSSYRPFGTSIDATKRVPIKHLPLPRRRRITGGRLEPHSYVRPTSTRNSLAVPLPTLIFQIPFELRRDANCATINPSNRALFAVLKYVFFKSLKYVRVRVCWTKNFKTRKVGESNDGQS